MPPPSAAIGTKEAARDLLEEILKDPNIPPEEADFMRDYINRRLHGWCFIMVNVVGKAMACFDRGAIIIKPQLWFDKDVTVWYKSVRAGVVK